MLTPIRNPKVSIGMPVYNGERYIREALDSLLAQTFTDFELIISDNASSDGTEAICREYTVKDRRIRYVRQLNNLGAIANFQFVLDEAVADFFMWAAADDVWDNTWIEVLYPIARKNMCLAYGMVKTIDDKGEQLPHSACGRCFVFTGNPFTRRMKFYLEPAFLGKANPIYGIFPKAIFDSSVFEVFEMKVSGADMLALYKLLSTTEIMSGGQVYLSKRIHSGCVGVGVGQNSHCNYPKKTARVLLGTIRSLRQQLADYGSISTDAEHLAHILLYPFSLTFMWAHMLFKTASRQK